MPASTSPARGKARGPGAAGGPAWGCGRGARPAAGARPRRGCRDHSLLIDAPHRLAFIACDGNARLLVFDLASLRVTSVQTVGNSPDVLAFDSSMQRLYVAAESGIVAVFDERRRTLHKVAEGFVAAEAHVIAVDPRTHRLYLPLEDVDGKPVLRVAAWAGRR
jgi:hypothetical protein